MSESILIFPFGGSARETLLSILDINKQNKKWDIVGFIDDNQSTWGKECCGFKVIGGREKLKEYPTAKVIAVPADPKSYLKKKTIIENLNIEPKRFATIIHPSVFVASDSKIGINTVIMPGCFVSSGAVIGGHVVVLPNSVISHDSIVGDYSFIGSNVAISGSVTIGSECFIASGSTLRDGIAIGHKSFVGLASNVIKSIEGQVTVAGNPAKMLDKVK